MAGETDGVIQNLNTARENVIKFDPKKNTDALEIIKERYKQARATVEGLSSTQPDAEALKSALDKDAQEIKKSADEAIANLNQTREALVKLDPTKETNSAVLNDLKQKHVQAEKVATELFYKIEGIGATEALKGLNNALERDDIEMKKYAAPATKPAHKKPSALIGGAEKLEKDVDLETRVKKAFKNDPAYTIKGDADQVLVLKGELPQLTVKRDGMTAHVNLTTDAKLTEHVLNTAKDLYGEPLIVFSADPEEKAHIEKVAGEMGIKMKMAETAEEYQQLVGKTPDAKPDVNKDTTQKVGTEKFSDPHKPNVLPESMTPTPKPSVTPTTATPAGEDKKLKSPAPTAQTVSNRPS